MTFLLARWKNQARGERRALERMAKVEKRKADERIKEATRDKERAAKAAELASRQREGIEHEVAVDRALAGASDEPIGSLRARLRRITGRGSGTQGGAGGSN